MITAMHAIVTSDPPSRLNKETNLDRIIKDTKECLEGNKTEEETNTISRDLLQYSMERWPQFYQTRSGNCRQEDVAEYLTRVLSSDKNLESEVETTIAHATTCPNSKNCGMNRKELISHEVINIVSDLQNVTEITLQQILRKITCKEKPIVCPKCKAVGHETKEIINAPKKLIVQVNRAVINGRKINTAITCKDREMYLEVNERKVRYKVTGAIIHLGHVTENGHYVYNYYDEEKEKWVQIDDDNISLFDMREENRDATIFILKQVTENENPKKTGKIMIKPDPPLPEINFVHESTVLSEKDNAPKQEIS